VASPSAWTYEHPLPIMGLLSPRVAYFPDSFHEINGVAHTSRQFEAYARRHNRSFLCIRAGQREEPFLAEGEVASLELPRGLLSFALEKDLRFDPAFLRHAPFIIKTLREFHPDVVHITGPSEVGMLGAALAHHLQLPLVASWHTNIHEYAARRSHWFLRHLSPEYSERTAKRIEELTMQAAGRFYKLARILFAPNQELCSMLEKATGRSCFLMPRGVDTITFSPQHRNRAADDREFVLGFVGRLSIEKNVTLLATIQEQLCALGLTRFRFLIIGHGSEEGWLREHLPNAEFTGVLRGAELSRAYANMDIFVFPSHTDAFGNVVLEALASGVPAVVTPDGGPRYIVREGITGAIASDEEFSAAIARILTDQALHAKMRVAARNFALTASWDAVFDGVYAAYQRVLHSKQFSAVM
jgi:phosphatidylinositol alpha 1,6-mannosyltransferase